MKGKIFRSSSARRLSECYQAHSWLEYGIDNHGGIHGCKPFQICRHCLVSVWRALLLHRGELSGGGCLLSAGIAAWADFFLRPAFFRSYHFDLYKGNLVLRQKRQVLSCTGLAILYVLSIPYLGYYISSALFILAISLVLQFRSKLIPIIVAVAFPLAIYLVFEILLKIPVPGISL